MKTSLAPLVVTHRDPKGTKFVSVVTAAYDKAALTEDEAQRVNNTPGLADHIAQFIADHRTRMDFANEEVKSKYGYLSGYRKPTSISDQVIRLRELWPDLLSVANPAFLRGIESREVKLPQFAEGWFAIPNLAKPEVLKRFGGSYCGAVQVTLDEVEKTRKGNFTNYWNGKIDEDHLRQSARSVEFWKKLSEDQGNPDIVVIAAQFGLRHRGRSVRRARVIMEDNPGEIGLGAFHVGAMLLTHPIRLQHYDDLWIDCGEDEFSPDGDDDFSVAPFFWFGDDRVWFGT